MVCHIYLVNGNVVHVKENATDIFCRIAGLKDEQPIANMLELHEEFKEKTVFIMVDKIVYFRDRLRG